MLRGLQTARLRAVLNGLKFTTDSGGTATINIGADDFKSVTRSAAGAATLTFLDELVTPVNGVLVGSVGANVVGGGWVQAGSHGGSSLAPILNGAASSGDDGTGYLLHVGFESESEGAQSPLQAVKNWCRNPRLMGFRIASGATIGAGGLQAKTISKASSVYTLTFTNAFGRTCVAVACPIAATQKAAKIDSSTASNVVVSTYNSSESAEDNNFYLLVLGWDSNDEQGNLRRVVQVPQRKPRLIAGAYDSSGAEIIVGDEEFSITKNATGDFSLAWTKAFADEPIVVATGQGRVQNGAVATTTGASILTFGATGSAADCDFGFIALGYDTAEEK